MVTNPDRPSGRGMELTAPPVKQRAVELGLEVVQFPSAKGPEMHELVASSGADVAVVVAYGRILPGALLEAVPAGFVNVHFSLLPEYSRCSTGAASCDRRSR